MSKYRDINHLILPKPHCAETEIFILSGIKIHSYCFVFPSNKQQREKRWCRNGHASVGEHCHHNVKGKADNLEETNTMIRRWSSSVSSSDNGLKYGTRAQQVFLRELSIKSIGMLLMPIKL